MSYVTDGTYAVYDEGRSKARKQHTCDACDRTIEPGQYYMRIRWVFDGSAGGVKRCGACQVTHEHLRELCRASGSDLWPDEELNCGLVYRDEWNGDPPEEIAALPLLSAEEVSALLEPARGTK